MIIKKTFILINGKGQPGQVMYVGHGVGTARFHNIRIGVTKEDTATDGTQ